MKTLLVVVVCLCIGAVELHHGDDLQHATLVREAEPAPISEPERASPIPNMAPANPSIASAQRQSRLEASSHRPPHYPPQKPPQLPPQKPPQLPPQKPPLNPPKAIPHNLQKDIEQGSLWKIQQSMLRAPQEPQQEQQQNVPAGPRLEMQREQQKEAQEKQQTEAQQGQAAVLGSLGPVNGITDRVVSEAQTVDGAISSEAELEADSEADSKADSEADSKADSEADSGSDEKDESGERVMPVPKVSRVSRPQRS